MHTNERLRQIRNEAEKLTSEFASHEPSGWKDPRNCLTLPFWLQLIPDAKIIICLRHPAESARSAAKIHTILSYARCLELWLIYNRRLIEYTKACPRMICQYDTLFKTPRLQLRSMLDFLGMTATENVIEKACKEWISDGLRHQHVDVSSDSSLPPEVADLYTEMCNEAERIDIPGHPSGSNRGFSTG